MSQKKNDLFSSSILARTMIITHGFRVLEIQQVPLFLFSYFLNKKMKLRCTVRKMSFFVRKVKLSTQRSTKTWKTFRCFVVHFTNILAFLEDENMILRFEIDINISRKKSEKSRTFAIYRVSKTQSPHFRTFYIF